MENALTRGESRSALTDASGERRRTRDEI